MLAVHRIIPLLLLCLAPYSAHAADGDFLWARGMGGPQYDEGKAIALDGAGNVYTMGSFEGTVDFDPSAAVYNLTSEGVRDIFLQKLDPAGNFVWARHFGRGGGDWHEVATDIAVDGLGNIYTTGYFEYTVDFDPGDEVLDLTSAGRYDIFLQKLNTNGSFVWARRFGGSGMDRGRGVAVDQVGNVYTTGHFERTIDFDPGEEVYNLTSAGSDDIFVQKLDENGNFLWARGMGGAYYHEENSIAVDGAGSVYTTGDFFGVVDFDPGAGTYNLNGHNYNSFVHKLDVRGNFAWVRARGGSISDWGVDIAVDGAGNVLSIARDGLYSFYDEWAEVGWFVYDSVIQKHDKDGNLAWAINLGHYSGYNNTGEAKAIAADPLGNVYIMGYFSGTMDFDPGEGTTYLTSSTAGPVFVQKLDAGGNFVWARGMGGPQTDGHGIAVDHAGNVYTTGSFSGTGDFDTGAGTLNLTATGRSDIFVQKISGPNGSSPRAISIGAATTGPTNADSMVFTVTFDEAVQNFNATSDLLIAHDGTASTGALVSGGPSVYSVTVSGISGDGRFTLAVNTSSDVRDLAGNGMASSMASPAVLIDNTPPAVGIGIPTQFPVSSRGTASYPVTIDGAGSINLISGKVTLNHSGTAGGSVTIVDGDSASPKVQVTGVTGDGNYTISLLAGIATDPAGNPSPAAGPSDPVYVDNTPPSILIGAPTGSPVNSSGMASFPVTMSGDGILFLASSDVTLNHSGTAGGNVVVVDGLSASPTVQVSGVTGDGNYTISVAAGVAADVLGNKSLAAGPSSPVAVDNTPPSVSIGVPTGSVVNSSGTATYPVTVSGGSSINLTSGDVTLNHSGTAGGSVVVVDGASATPSVQVSGVTGEGSCTISIAAGIAVDALGNTSLAAGPGSPVTVDNTPPTVSIGTPTGGVVNSSRMATYPVTVSGARITELSSGDVSLHHSGTAGGSINIVTGRSAAPLVQVSGVTGNGSYTISIAAGIATDAAANASLAIGPSTEAVTVDNSAPTVSIGAPTGTPVNRNGTVSFPVTVSGASNINLTRSDVSLQRNGASGGSVNILNGTGATPTVEVSRLTGTGNCTISIAAGIATDAATNASLAAGPGAMASVDNINPVFSSVVASPAEALEGNTIAIRFESSEPIVGDPVVTVNGNPATRTAKAGYDYEYTVEPTDPPGPATIEIGGADLAGNTVTLSNSSALIITETAVEGGGDVDGEAEGEGEGEGENPPVGCGGCNAEGGPMEKSLGDWLAAFLGFAVLLGAHLSLRSRLAA